MALKYYFFKKCYFIIFNSFALRIFSNKYNQKKIIIGLQEYPDVMSVFLFCCFTVYVIKGKTFQISPTPVMFCLEKGLSRDSFMHCLKSCLKRSAPWRIDISNLFRSVTSSLHPLFSSCASSWATLA